MQRVNTKASSGYGFRMLVFAVLMAAVLLFSPQAWAEQTGIEIELVYLEDQQTAYIPLRATGEALGLEITWEGRTATAYADGVAYSIAAKNGAVLVAGRTYVPLALFGKNNDIYYSLLDANTAEFRLMEAADAERMAATIDTISKTHRYWRGDEIKAPRAYITETLQSLGYAVESLPFVHPGMDYNFLLDIEAEDVPPNLILTNHEAYVEYKPVEITGYNIVAKKMPQSRQKQSDILIVGAHYDSVQGAPGANDNGSGVSALLEVARLVKDLPSDIEVRFVAFDAEEDGLFGSFYYAQSLTAEERARVIGMINFDMFAASAAETVNAATADGEPNFLTELFDEFALNAEIGSDHFSFYSLNIPSVSISHDVAGPYHSPDDVLEHLDRNKLQLAAAEGSAVIAYLMSDATPSLLPATLTTPEATVYKLAEDAAFPMYSSRQSIEEALQITTTQIATRNAVAGQFDTAFTATLDWWGQPCETVFAYIYGDSMLSAMRVTVGDPTALTAALNQRFSPVADLASLSLQFDVDAAAKAWISESGNAYVLQKESGQDVMVVTNYNIQKPLEFKNGKLSASLTETEQKAWKRLEKLISKTGIEKQLSNVVFVNDGYGEQSLSLTPDVLTGNITLTLDAQELVNEQGALYQENALTQAFMWGYAQSVFKNPGQMDAPQVKTPAGIVYGYLYNGYQSTSYFAAYQKAFNLTVEVTEEDSLYLKYWQEEEIITEMCNAFIAYVTGINEAEIEEAKIQFFAAYPEFAKLKQ